MKPEDHSNRVSVALGDGTQDTWPVHKRLYLLSQFTDLLFWFVVAGMGVSYIAQTGLQPPKNQCPRPGIQSPALVF